MKKSVVMVFLILVLISALGVSSTRVGKLKAGKPISIRPTSVAALVPQPNSLNSNAIRKEDPQDSHKVILTLQTRNYLLTIYGGADQFYSVSTQDGVALAEKLDLGELKVRFPELHELLNGSWACDSPIADARF
jgi:hypothetical protein